MYTHKDTHTHTQTQCCMDHHFVSVLAYPLFRLPPFSFPICFSVSGLFAASAGLNTADSSSGDDRTAVNLKTHNGNT